MRTLLWALSMGSTPGISAMVAFLLLGVLVGDAFPSSNGKKHNYPIQIPHYKILPRGRFEREIWPRGRNTWKHDLCKGADDLGTKFTPYFGKRANLSPEMNDGSENRLNRGLILIPWDPRKTRLQTWGSPTRYGHLSCRCLFLIFFAGPH